MTFPYDLNHSGQIKMHLLFILDQEVTSVWKLLRNIFYKKRASREHLVREEDILKFEKSWKYYKSLKFLLSFSKSANEYKIFLKQCSLRLVILNIRIP